MIFFRVFCLIIVVVGRRGGGGGGGGSGKIMLLSFSYLFSTMLFFFSIDLSHTSYCYSPVVSPTHLFLPRLIVPHRDVVG